MGDPLELLERGVAERDRALHEFFDREAEGLAEVSRGMAHRFARGGRLLAFGTAQGATDAQHVAVEFVHPVIVGKSALPALDVSRAWQAGVLRHFMRPDDIVIGFTAAEMDGRDTIFGEARRLGAFTMGLPGRAGEYAVSAPHVDPFVSQEIIEILYHVAWESVHVFREHEATGSDTGPASFLYPFLGTPAAQLASPVGPVADSIRTKAATTAALRASTLAAQAETMIAAAAAIRERVTAGGKLLFFGNGGSATDANDWTLDCLEPPKPYRPLPAISLSADAATLTALANDVGVEAMFLRQIVAFGSSRDVAVAISTSGGSSNVLSALIEARRRGLLTVALVGHDGGEVVRQGLADFAVVVKCDYVPRIQEVQASVYHMLCDLLAA